LASDRFDEAVAIAREQAEDDGAEEVCVIGGAALFALALPKAKRIYLTEVDADIAGDVVMDPIDEGVWREVRRVAYPAGPADEHPFVFRVLSRA
jgi:dihydrofolate reductase